MKGALDHDFVRHSVKIHQKFYNLFVICFTLVLLRNIFKMKFKWLTLPGHGDILFEHWREYLVQAWVKRTDPNLVSAKIRW